MTPTSSLATTKTVSFIKPLQQRAKFKDYDVGNLVKVSAKIKFNKKKLAVIVPFRDAFDELDTFAPHMAKYFNNQMIPFHIFIINQKDNLRFNRGALVNIGYLYTSKKFQYFVQHDVDYLPLNPKIPYHYQNDKAMLLVPFYLRPGCIKSKVLFD